MNAFIEHGRAIEAIETDVDLAESSLQSLQGAGIEMEQVTAKLLEDGLQSFADSYDELLANIDEKRSRLAARGEIPA